MQKYCLNFILQKLKRIGFGNCNGHFVLFYWTCSPLFSNFSAGSSNQHQRFDPRISGKSGANSLFSQNSCWKKADNKVTFYEEFYKNIWILVIMYIHKFIFTIMCINVSIMNIMKLKIQTNNQQMVEVHKTFLLSLS